MELVAPDAAPLIEEVLLVASLLATELLPLWLRELLALVEGEVVAEPERLAFADVESLLATDVLLVDGVVLAVEDDAVSALAKPLVLPVWLRELVALVEGDDVAEPEVLVLAAVESLLATELLVDGVVLEVEDDALSELAKPLVLPVWLRELLELVEGDDVAAPEVLVLAAVESLLATELLVDGVVLEVEDDAVSELAKPLVLPVWLRELLELVEGEDVAAPEVLVLAAVESLLAIELLVDGVVLDVLPLMADVLFAAAEPLTL